MGISLNGLTPAGTYPGLIKTGDNTAISGTPKVLSDGNGNNLPMEVSTTGVNLTGSPTVNSVAIANTTQVAAKQDTLVSGTNIKTINGASVLGSGNIVTPTTSPSGVAGAIQFSDGSAFASDATNFFWDNVNKRLGVRTNTPTASGHFRGVGITSATSSLIAQNSAGTTFFQVQDDSAIRVQDGGLMKNFSATGTYNLDFGRLFIRGGDSSSNGALSIGTTSTAARVVFQGSGSTSATTSLLVQNSSGTHSMSVRDNGSSVFGPQSAVEISNIISVSAQSGNQNLIQSFGGVTSGTTFRGGLDTSNVNFEANTNGGVFRSSGTTAQNASSVLDLQSTTRGFLPPRMTTTQKNAITAVAGLVLYDSTTNKLQCYNGSTWNDLF
jgi:hypothetical protein